MIKPKTELKAAAQLASGLGTLRTVGADLEQATAAALLSLLERVHTHADGRASKAAIRNVMRAIYSNGERRSDHWDSWLLAYERMEDT